ncbi:G-type lectin S-receptor-like serine/threonine-protein kinase LECRK3 [Tripterygium wilfordii]|uniref:G-type lectin S-receptor-like serine/threonine-protein kinase LECRK3 n=1 Tax=Tripterygium wilfordii TaxID=458696 RepID=UPI0018F7F36D|nr:G-type lectin S-receptor-like serine/threonine-protein kinase LECRK3 [Tripterygium wilfordii]
MASRSVPKFLLFFLLLPSFAISQNNGTTISTNQSFTAGEEATPWLSPSRDFALGFRQLDTNINLFLLAIWYYKIPSRTIVWYANGDKPAPRGSKVEFTTDRGLVLDNPDGNEIWRTNFSSSVVANGVFTDRGNLVIGSRNSETLWESFDHPTDTLLPTQVMDRGGVVSSRRTETNFSRGRFRFQLLEDGNAVLNTISLETGFDYDAYFWSNTFSTDSSVAGFQVVFNESGLLYVLRANGSRVNVLTGDIPSTKDYYHRATLSFDGVFTQYYHPKAFSGNPSWSVVQRVPENICLDIRAELGAGACGFNSICKITESKRPACECPPGHSLLDPNDAYGSCKPDFSQGCEQYNSSSAGDLSFEEVQHVDWPISDYERLDPSTIEMCRSSCLNDCICAVAIFRGSTCWKKKLPLSNGRVNSDDNGMALIKIRKSNEEEKEKKNAKNILIVIVSVLFGGSFIANIALLGACCLGFLVINQSKFKKPDQGENLWHVNLHCFTYKDLIEATNGFKEEVGRGAFGTVFKGFIGTSPSSVVAVKRLDRVFRDGEKEFKAEVNVIGQTHHKNLVRLIGYCDDGQHRLLVYEFLSNGTLSSFLFESKPKPNWNLRIRIAFGIARGLLYLHEECNTQIIHCDIKPQNILLDDHYNARISDFGLAKLLMIDQSHTHTAIRGTKGYVAPEWFRNMPITVKVDVYSYGVMLLEIICCRKSVENDFDDGEKAILTDWAYDCYREGIVDALVEDDAEAINEMEKLKRLVKVGIWCIQEDPSLRPTMKKVLQMLEGVVEILEPPCPSPFSMMTAVTSLST